MDPVPLSCLGSQRPRSRSRRCLLKGCEQWFQPTHPQGRYCRVLAVRRHGAGGAGGRSRTSGPALRGELGVNNKHVIIASAVGSGPIVRQQQRHAQLQSRTPMTRRARVSAQPEKAKKICSILATGRAATCSLPWVVRTARGVFVVGCAARLCVAYSSAKHAGEADADAVCSVPAGDRVGRRAAHNDVFVSGGPVSGEVISLGP